MTPATSSDEPLFFDRSEQPIDLARYAELHANIGYRTRAGEQALPR